MTTLPPSCAVFMKSGKLNFLEPSGPLQAFNPFTLNDLYMSRTAPLTSKRCILYIYSTNVGTEYFKHALYYPFLSLQNAVCFIMLTCLVSPLFTFSIQGVLKLKKKSGAKGLTVLIYLIYIYILKYFTIYIYQQH